MLLIAYFLPFYLTLSFNPIVGLLWVLALLLNIQTLPFIKNLIIKHYSLNYAFAKEIMTLFISFSYFFIAEIILYYYSLENWQNYHYILTLSPFFIFLLEEKEYLLNAKLKKIFLLELLYLIIFIGITSLFSLKSLSTFIYIPFNDEFTNNFLKFKTIISFFLLTIYLTLINMINKVIPSKIK